MPKKSTHLRVPAALAFAFLFAPRAFSAPADTRLAEAAKNANWAAMHAALKQHASVHGRLPDGTAALHWAVFWSEEEAVETLTRAGAQVDATDDNGITPLGLASANGNAAITRTLLKAGANPNLSRPSGETPVMTAARSGNLDTVKELLAHGAAVNAHERSKAQTALMWSVDENHLEIVKLL